MTETRNKAKLYPPVLCGSVHNYIWQIQHQPFAGQINQHFPYLELPRQGILVQLVEY